MKELTIFKGSASTEGVLRACRELEVLTGGALLTNLLFGNHLSSTNYDGQILCPHLREIRFLDDIAAGHSQDLIDALALILELRVKMPDLAPGSVRCLETLTMWVSSRQMELIRADSRIRPYISSNCFNLELNLSRSQGWKNCRAT